MRPKKHWAVEVYMPFWTKGKGTGVWNFRKKVDNSQVGETAHMINKFLLRN